MRATSETCHQCQTVQYEQIRGPLSGWWEVVTSDFQARLLAPAQVLPKNFPEKPKVYPTNSQNRDTLHPNLFKLLQHREFDVPLDTYIVHVLDAIVSFAVFRVYQHGSTFLWCRQSLAI